MTSRPHQAGIKRALSHLGGPVDTEGDAGPAKSLAFALEVMGAEGPEKHKLSEEAEEVSRDDEIDRAHVHGFHAYPARMHPVTASRLVTAFAPERGVVLDPFCGSGTVLVESLIAGREALGTDLNPLAVRLARSKTFARTDESRKGLISAAARVRALADDRRKERAGATKRYDKEDAAMFDPHVLLELDGLRQGIDKIDAPRTKEGLSLVLSSIANKVSRQASDTTSRESQRRWASGFVIQFFVRKTEELTKRQAQYAGRLGEGEITRACVKHGDAQQLPFENDSFRAVVTSPPYPGVYDYVEHHRLRLQWLGLNAEYLWQHEIGARRHAGANQSLRETFNAQLQRCLSEMARVVVPGGTVALIVADSVVDGSAWYADTEIEPLAGRAGLTLAAAAAQTRPHFHGSTARAFGRRPRSERVLFFRRK